MFSLTFYILHTHTWNFYENFLSLCLPSFRVSEGLWIWYPCQMIIHCVLLPEAPTAVKTCAGTIHSIHIGLYNNKFCLKWCPSCQTPPLPACTMLLLYSLKDRIQTKAFSQAVHWCLLSFPMMQLFGPSPLTLMSYGFCVIILSDLINKTLT